MYQNVFSYQILSQYNIGKATYRTAQPPNDIFFFKNDIIIDQGFTRVPLVIMIKSNNDHIKIHNNRPEIHTWLALTNDDKI